MFLYIIYALFALLIVVPLYLIVVHFKDLRLTCGMKDVLCRAKLFKGIVDASKEYNEKESDAVDVQAVVIDNYMLTFKE